MGRFADSSVVTEATRPSVFEFVTEARLSTKKGKVVEWTRIHQYELDAGEGAVRLVHAAHRSDQRAAGPAALFNVPGLRALIAERREVNVRRGFRNLVKMAQRGARARAREEDRDGEGIEGNRR